MQRNIDDIVESYRNEKPAPSVEEKIRAIDESVRKRARLWPIIIGIIGTLLLGIGMSLTMIPTDYFTLGVVVGVVGLIAVCITYPLYLKTLSNEQMKARSSILELSAQL